MILRILLMLVILVIIFGLPIWNLARLKGSQHVLWGIAPIAVFIALFQFSQILETSNNISLYIPIKALMYYWLIFSLLLFGITIAVMLLHYALGIKKTYTFWVIVAITFIVGLIARINGERIIIKYIELPAENITREYRFVHITDLHSGSTDKNHAQRVVNKIKLLNPEFTVITGDFIDEFHVTTDDIKPFDLIETPIYLITGNHEYYLDEGKINDVIFDTNIKLIDDQRIAFDELDIIGVNELATIDGTVDVLGGINPQRYTIILDHEPKTEEVHRAEALGTKLMLSGHTHKGQMWPMGLLLKLRYKYIAGLYEIGEMFLYVNQGTGTLGPKMRFGTANEITLITLIPQSTQ